mmetsp:Transcript_13394/g.20313  ORF Transcript_13394/g.20313 Transcript_13394/m.20313 type:complete len:105 (-) Transcript_13394:507-821(-)
MTTSIQNHVSELISSTPCKLTNPARPEGFQNPLEIVPPLVRRSAQRRKYAFHNARNSKVVAKWGNKAFLENLEAHKSEDLPKFVEEIGFGMDLPPPLVEYLRQS